MPIATAFLFAFFRVAFLILDFYIWILIVGAILSWLVAFDIVNSRNHFVQMVGDFIHRLTEPLLRRIRRIVPVVGGLDLSPLVLIFGIMFLKYFLQALLTQLAFL